MMLIIVFGLLCTLQKQHSAQAVSGQTGPEFATFNCHRMVQYWHFYSGSKCVQFLRRTSKKQNVKGGLRIVEQNLTYFYFQKLKCGYLPKVLRNYVKVHGAKYLGLGIFSQTIYIPRAIIATLNL